MRATALTEPGPVDWPLTATPATPAGRSTTTGDPHTNWTERRGPVNPFGAPLDSVPSNTTIHRFVGRWDRQYDTTTGDVLMGARPYDPTTGRFLSVDPIPGGSLNNYDYASQDATNDYDLNGTMHAEGVDWCAGDRTRGELEKCAIQHWALCWEYAKYFHKNYESSCTGEWNPLAGAVGACVRPALGFGSAAAFVQGFAKGRLTEGLAIEAAAKLGIHEVPLAGGLAGCLGGLIGHFR